MRTEFGTFFACVKLGNNIQTPFAMIQKDFLTKQLDVFANVLDRLFDLDKEEDLLPALHFVRQHVDKELFNKLSGSYAAVAYKDPTLTDEIEFLMYLKFTEVKIMEMADVSPFLLSEKSLQLLEMMASFLNVNGKSYYMGIENMRLTLVAKIKK